MCRCREAHGCARAAIVMIVLCAVLSDIKDWVGMEDFAYEKEAWLRGFLELPGGIPSHDTLSDVLGRIDHKAFTTAFGCEPCLARRAVPVDGLKSPRRGGIHARNKGQNQHRAPLLRSVPSSTFSDLPRRCVTTCALKTHSTGCWMCSLAKTPTAVARIIRQRTSP